MARLLAIVLLPRIEIDDREVLKGAQNGGCIVEVDQNCHSSCNGMEKLRCCRHEMVVRACFVALRVEQACIIEVSFAANVASLKL